MILLVFMTLSIVPLLSQPCSSSVITLRSQADVDNFQTMFGPCDSVTVRLEVGIYGAATDITDLSPLIDLKWTNWLFVIDNHELTTLAGLHNIVRDGAGKLAIQNNDNLADITALVGFGPTVGDMSIANNPLLTTLGGLQNITTVGTALTIRNNVELMSLNALAGITRIDRILEITRNESLTDISALSNLADFATGIPPNAVAKARFSIYENDLLEDCTPLCRVINEDLKRVRDINSLGIDSIQDNLSTCFDLNAINLDCVCRGAVRDTIKPVAICNNIATDIPECGNLNLTIGQIDGGSKDTCGLLSITIDKSIFTCADIGNNIVTLIATDVNGNAAACTSDVALTDPNNYCIIDTIDIANTINQTITHCGSNTVILKGILASGSHATIRAPRVKISSTFEVADNATLDIINENCLN